MVLPALSPHAERRRRDDTQTTTRADVSIEAVGTPEAFELTVSLARAAGRIATSAFLRLLAGHQLDATRFVTHHFTLDQFMDAYDVFRAQAKPARSRSC